MTARGQQAWDRLRSELTACLPRPTAQDVHHRPVMQPRPAFAACAGAPYYGPTRQARAAVNRILGLDLAAAQPEWQVAIASAETAEQAHAAFADPAHDLETRSALALLLLDRMDRSAAFGPVRSELVARIHWQLRRDPQVQARMRYFWTHMEGSAPVLEALS